ncbi:DASH complex, subunit Spc34 [Saccharata proteae CBS 121410]|uniref:DASH complex subunit SPC34 n=1 Tax=Saccharata proteae CBS 121410 TaxID=1314787 RepID=A0A9P4HX74_9PEZI|nr:DASH complex, subunit Spc34 [Saccharata proteae CBS 121410]
MSLLDTHLEQISLCSASIADLPFPPPKIFTNALLHPHDITTLIRDTESHERALFSVPPPPPAPKAQDANVSSNRRNTVFNAGGGANVIGGGGANAMRAPRRNTAVAAVLGSELVERIRLGGGGGAGSGLGYRPVEGRNKSEIDVDVLLEGAEKLLGVYPVAGAAAKIASLRQRHARLTSSIEEYEYRVAEQQAELSRMNKPRDFEDDDAEPIPEEVPDEVLLTADDLAREEEEIRELERKKRTLEARVSSMSRDISGVLR